MAYAQMVSENAPLTMAAAKYAMRQALMDESQKNLLKARELVKACYSSEDYREGRKAFAEKRTPIFKGL
jgi:enoyl-CoA hydratase/carnithine racemase